MKRIAVLALALAMAMSMTACGNGNSSASDSNSGSGSNVGSSSSSEGQIVDYPTSDITFVVPAAAGGGNDLATRALIPSLEEPLGVTIVPLNQGESGGAVAANTVMSAEPNGTVLYFNSQTLVTTALTTVTSIDLDQFQPVAQAGTDLNRWK